MIADLRKNGDDLRWQTVLSAAGLDLSTAQMDLSVRATELAGMNWRKSHRSEGLDLSYPPTHTK